MKKIHHFRVELEEMNDKIWRTIQVRDDMNGLDFALFLMIIFRTKAYHSFEFRVDLGKRIAKMIKNDYPNPNQTQKKLLKEAENYKRIFSVPQEYDIDDEEYIERYDINKSKIAHLFASPEDRFLFLYDFGDGWTFEIKHEKTIEVEKYSQEKCPLILDGKGFGIVEDVGGVGGLMRYIKTIEGGKNKKRDELVAWYGRDIKDFSFFDYEAMNLKVKKALRLLRKTYLFDQGLTEEEDAWLEQL